MSPAIEVVDLVHAYPGPRGPVEALRGVTLAVQPGEFFGLFGPNGAGKTTFIRVLATLVTPAAGAARVAGWDVRRDAARVRAAIGLVFSNEHSFYGRLSGRQNLEFFGALQNLTPRAARGRAAELLAFFGLERAADAPVQSYSTGMRQKLNVARALLHDPAVVFLDEPTKGLDALTAEALRALLRRELVERQGKTILLTTHDLQEMEQLCNRVAIVESGRLRAVGAPADLAREAGRSVVYRLEVADPSAGLAEQLARLPGLVAVEPAAVTGSAAVLDLTFEHAPDADLWRLFADLGARVVRFGPKEEGLVTVLKEFSYGLHE